MSSNIPVTWRNVLPTQSEWLNWSSSMVKWYGGRKRVSYVERFEEIWPIRSTDRWMALRICLGQWKLRNLKTGLLIPKTFQHNLTHFLPLHHFQHLHGLIQLPWRWSSTFPWHSAERKKLIPPCKHAGWQPSFGQDTPNAPVTVISNRCNYT